MSKALAVGKDVFADDGDVVVTNETVRRVNAVVGGGNWVDDVADEYVTEAVVPVGTAVVSNGVVTSGARVPARPAKPGEFFDDKHHHRKGAVATHTHGHKGQVATVASERALLDDVARHRAALVGTIDELHTRLSPKYQIDQLKSTWTQAGTDALSILKNEGGPVDEERKKKAEAILKGGGALAGLVGLHSLRKLCKKAKTARTVRKAVAKGMPPEHVELVGLVEPVEYDEAGEFAQADHLIFGEFDTE